MSRFSLPVRALALAAVAAIATACAETPTSGKVAGPEFSSVAPISNYTIDDFEATANAGFGTNGSVSDFRTANTIPYWSSTFTDPTNGVTYPFTMVGTNPFTGNDQTTVPTVIIPFRFTFASGVVMDGGAQVANALASPIFSDYTYPLSANDRTQYADAIQRAQFNKIGTSYHVRLGQPDVLPVQDIAVPQKQGLALRLRVGGFVGLVDDHWFSDRLFEAINSNQVPATAIPIILVDNTFTFVSDNINNCCILGFHGATSSRNGNGNQQVQTFIYASWVTPGTFRGFPAQGRGLSDIHALSHEISELYDDPFVNNLVNPWLTPTAPQYGCTGILETGDPVVGFWFPLPGNSQTNARGLWHPEDEVFFSWFARQSPSIAYAGRYTYIGTFTTIAHGC